jgi:serine/threonine protein kinase/tetratricopeptide (TPR) repeat protein
MNASTSAEAKMALSAGTRLGPYEIISSLGAGGMGEVYRARDPRLGRDVAVKVMPAAFSADAERLRRFEQEARAAAALSHPNIVAVYDVGTHDGTPYVVSELLEGSTLQARLSSGRLDIDTTVDWGIQIAAGLEAAHVKGLVHRDLKLSNLFVTTVRQIKILDFGLVKMPNALPDSTIAPTMESPATELGAMLGTIPYMSPEQARGGAVDTRSDVFALGAVLYEMAVGQPAFSGPTSAVIFDSILNRPVRVRETNISVDLAAVIDRALAKRPEDRYAHGGEIAAALRAVKASRDSGSWPGRAPPRILPSIGVLPFVDMSPDRDQGYFCEGMAEELITALSGLAGVRVASRSSSFRFKDSALDIQQVGMQLHVAHVLEGSVRKAGSRLRITVQLVNVADASEVWAERYDRSLDDIFAVQDEIAHAVVSKLKVRLGRDEDVPLVKHGTHDIDAYHDYMQGRFLWGRRTEAGLRKGIHHFQKAIEKAPAYARAYSGLADCWHGLGWYSLLAPNDAFPKAMSAARKALAIDESLPEAHTSLAYETFLYDWNWSGAEKEFKRAIELDPRYPTAHQWYADLFATTGRTEQAIFEATRAAELDPLSPVVNAWLGWNLYHARQFDRATDRHQKTIELDPTFIPGHWLLALACDQVRRFGQAIEHLQTAVSLSEGSPVYIASLAYAYGAAGRSIEARTLLQQLDELSAVRYIPSCQIAAVYAGLGEREAALERLDRAYEERSHWLVYLRDPRFDSLRSDPRFAALLRRMTLDGAGA